MFRPLLPDEAPEVTYEPATFFASQDNQAYLSRKSLDFRGTDIRLTGWDNFGYALRVF